MDIFGVAGSAKVAAYYETGSTASVDTGGGRIATIDIQLTREPIQFNWFIFKAYAYGGWIDLVNNQKTAMWTSSASGGTIASVTWSFNSSTKILHIVIDGTSEGRNPGGTFTWHALEV